MDKVEYLGGSVGQAAALGSGHDPGILGSSPLVGLPTQQGVTSSSPSTLPAAPSPCSLSLSNK